VRTGAERWRLAVALVGVLGVQVALAGRLRPWGNVADVMVLAVAGVAGAGGRRTGAAFGFAAGLVMDLYQAGPLGLTALAYTLVGHALGRAEGQSHTVIGDFTGRTTVKSPFIAARAGCVLAAARRGALASAGALVLLVAGGALLGGQPPGPLHDLAARLAFATGSGAVLAPLVAGGLVPLVAPVRRRQRHLALRRARALRPAGALARR
jgi:hypothetical protein